MGCACEETRRKVVEGCMMERQGERRVNKEGRNVSAMLSRFRDRGRMFEHGCNRMAMERSGSRG